MINPDKDLGSCIVVFKDVFSDSHEIINILEKENKLNLKQESWSWEKAGTIGYGSDQNVRTNYTMAITKNAKFGNENAKKIHNLIFTKVEEAIAWYKNRYNIPFELYHEPYTVLKYSNNVEYKPHFDGSTETARSVSVVIYLNDDYDGGEIEFTNFNLKLKPEANSMIFFPSNFAYTHKAHPVTSGTKYAIVTCLHDWLSPEVPQFPIKKSLLNIGIVGLIK